MGIPFSETCIRAALSIIGLPLSIVQLLISKVDSMKHKPIGQMIKIGSKQLHAHVTGSGPVTIILESGMGGCALDWCLVQPELSKYATVVSYDRAGLGWSYKSKWKSTSSDFNYDLRLLLSALKLKPPYVLVGHSFGGMNMQLFAADYPDEVSGLVLVDSVHEDRYLFDRTDSKRKEQFGKASKQYRLGYILSPLGIPRMMKLHIGASRLPPNVQPFVKSLGFRSNAYKAVYKELLFAEEIGRQLRDKKNHIKNDLPVRIISAGKQPDPWKKQQDLLKQLSNNTEQIIIEGSPHAIHLHQPEIVIDEIKKAAKI